MSRENSSCPTVHESAIPVACNQIKKTDVIRKTMQRFKKNLKTMKTKPDYVGKKKMRFLAAQQHLRNICRNS